MANLLDQALEQFLSGSIKGFEDHLRKEDLGEEAVKAQVRGAKGFVGFLFGRPPRKRSRRYA